MASLTETGMMSSVCSRGVGRAESEREEEKKKYRRRRRRRRRRRWTQQVYYATIGAVPVISL